MRKCLSVLISFSIIFSACNNPLGKTYNSETYLQDISAIKESGKVNNRDIELLTNYIAIASLAGTDLQGKTYEEILEKIKNIRDASIDETDKAKLEKDELRQRMSTLLKVDLSGKVFGKVDDKDCFTYTVTFKNLSSKNIKMIVGSISLNDLLDREIKNIQILSEEELKANAVLKKTYIVAYEHNNENDKRIRAEDLVDLRILWNPEKIIFTDGTVAD